MAARMSADCWNTTGRAGETAVLSLRTFCTFLRELSSQPPHRFGGVEAAGADAR